MVTSAPSWGCGNNFCHHAELAHGQLKDRLLLINPWMLVMLSTGFLYPWHWVLVPFQLRGSRCSSPWL